MYRLYHDEVTGTFFEGDEATVDRNLTLLINQLMQPDGSFDLCDYCHALDIANEDPFHSVNFERGFFDIPYVFDQYLAERSGITVMCVGIRTS